MAATNLPWSIKGVTPEARVAAKRAAEEDGLPIGAWLNQIIREVSRTEENAVESGAIEVEEPAEATDPTPAEESAPQPQPTDPD